jgi:hypothetical protein
MDKYLNCKKDICPPPAMTTVQLMIVVPPPRFPMIFFVGWWGQKMAVPPSQRAQTPHQIT